MAEFSEDEKWMLRALEIASKPDHQTRPNPQVGCVIVKNNRTIGEGFHEKAGMLHAERMALKNCKESPDSATAYVTLEPCNHHGRTPPCSDALIEAKISRVVIAQSDPNPEADGGIEKLQAAGIEVVKGVLETEAKRLNPAFTKFFEHKLPLVTLKWAMSLDGCTSAPNGESKWITGEESRKRVHRQRAQHDAIMVGIETALRDQARLTVRDWPLIAKPPIRVIVDSNLRIPPDHPLFEKQDGNIEAPVIIFCKENASSEKESALKDAGAEIFRIESDESGTLSIKEILLELAQRKVMSLYVEGGRKLSGSFMKSGQVDRVFTFIAPRIIGSSEVNTSAILSQNMQDCMAHTRELLETEIEIIDSKDILVSGWIKTFW